MTTPQSTADLVLAYLATYDLKRIGNAKYAANRPWSTGSDSQALKVLIHDGEHGCYKDHVEGSSGSLYDLAKRLGIPLSSAGTSTAAPPSSKRAYTGIDDYATEHGIDATVLTSAGWSVRPHYCKNNKVYRPALHIPTSTGTRIRYLDDLKPSYRSPKDYEPCWYRLAEAAQIANQTGQPLVIVNGEVSALAGQHRGVAATTIPGGEEAIANKLAGGLLAELQSVYAGSIFILLDCDPAGRTAALAVKDVLSEAGYVAYAKDMSGYKGFDAANFFHLHGLDSASELQNNLPDVQQQSATASPGSSQNNANGRTIVEVFDRPMHDIAPEVWDAIIASNTPPTLFRTNGTLLALTADDNDAAVLMPVDKHRLRALLSRCCVFQETRDGRSATKTITQRSAPDDIVQYLLHTIDERLPIVTHIVHCPTFAPDGTLLDQPGYHASARLFYDPRPGLTIPPIPERPTEADAEQAKSLLNDDLLRDFPFVTAADRTHAIALMLLPYVRGMIPGPTPLHLVEAPIMGSGKSLLAQVLMLPALGTEPSAMAEGGDDAEWRKRITASILDGSSIIFIDNANSTIASGALAMALTAREITDRVLGRSEQVRLPVRCTWLMTTNNAATSTEIARRSIRIRIDPRVDKPWERNGFKHSDLNGWVKANQGRLIWAACTLIRYGLQHGRPGRLLGSFEDWASLMGRVLNGCGFADFLGNLQDLYDRADSEGAAWRELIELWWATYGDTSVRAADLYQIVAEHTLDLSLRGNTERALAVSFGRAISRMADRIFTLETGGMTRQFQIAQAGVSHKTSLWCLKLLTTNTKGGDGGERGDLQQLHTRIQAGAHAHMRDEAAVKNPPIPPYPPDVMPSPSETDTPQAVSEARVIALPEDRQTTAVFQVSDLAIISRLEALVSNADAQALAVARMSLAQLHDTDLRTTWEAKITAAQQNTETSILSNPAYRAIPRRPNINTLLAQRADAEIAALQAVPADEDQ